MKRLLLTGAFVASVLFWAPVAQADDAMNHRVLQITVIMQKPNGDRFQRHTWLTFETRYTCDEGQERLDLDFIKDAEAARLKSKHISVLGVSAECVEAGPLI